MQRDELVLMSSALHMYMCFWVSMMQWYPKRQQILGNFSKLNSLDKYTRPCWLESHQLLCVILYTAVIIYSYLTKHISSVYLFLMLHSRWPLKQYCGKSANLYICFANEICDNSYIDVSVKYDTCENCIFVNLYCCYN